MRSPRLPENLPLQLPAWLVLAALGAIPVFLFLYLIAGREGRTLIRAWERWGVQSVPKQRELVLPTPSTSRSSKLYWLARDGLWSVQEERVAEALPDRIEQLCNLVLDRLGLDLLVIQAIVAEDDVAFLFFSVRVWEPTARQEVDLAQSLTRTLLTDLPWLRGLRLVLPSRHLDYTQPLRNFDPGFDPLLRKRRSTLGLEVSP